MVTQVRTKMNDYTYMLYIYILLYNTLIRMNKDPSSLETHSQALIPWKNILGGFPSDLCSSLHPSLSSTYNCLALRVPSIYSRPPGAWKPPIAGEQLVNFPDSAHRPCSFCNSSWETEWSGSGQGQGSQEVGLGVPGDLKGSAEAPLGSCPG